MNQAGIPVHTETGLPEDQQAHVLGTKGSDLLVSLELMIRVRTWVRADEVLASVERRTAPLARERGIRVTTSGSDRVVRVDRIRIEQALTNLVANAIAYSPTGSIIDMIAGIASTGPAEPAELNDTLTIEVLDRGPGIPPGEGDAVFLPFHRGPGTTVSGAGLGLATAAAAVRAHHGTIGFEPRNGGGTRFWIRVPV